MKHRLIGLSVFVALSIWMVCMVFSPTSIDSFTLSPHVICQDERGDQAEVNIKAPTTVKVGDVIYIDLSESLGAGFAFYVEPLPPGLRVFDEGRIIACGTGDKNVTYTFSISCALDDDSDIKVHKIKVTGALDVLEVIQPGENLVEKVKNWCHLVKNPSKEEAINLSRSFEDVAAQIEDGVFTSIAQVTKGTAASNRNALGDNLDYWIPLLDALMTELKAMDAMGILLDAESHAPVWREIAQGLKEYADTIE